MRIKVSLLPVFSTKTEDKVYIAIDALRATVTLTTLLDRGCQSIIPVRDADEALAVKEQLTKSHHKVLLCGEDSIGKLSPGFDLPNSPTELFKVQFENQIVIMNSTSGTKLFYMLDNITSVLVGCPLNANACAVTAIKQAELLGLDIEIICAGSKGNAQITLEDVACAGLILDRMQKLTQLELCDSGIIALQFFSQFANKSSLYEIFLKSDTAQRLIQGGFNEDIEFCSRIDTTSVVPFMKKDVALSNLLTIQMFPDNASGAYR
jgi:2-phosphosulfolactate phosphatase